MGPAICTGRIVTPGLASGPDATVAMIPATTVPCPWASTSGSPPPKAYDFARVVSTRLARPAACGATPVSSTATSGGLL